MKEGAFQSGRYKIPRPGDRRSLFRKRITDVKPKLSRNKIAPLVLILSLMCATLSAQETTVDKDIQKKEFELQLQKLNLEKKRLELQQKELDLQKAKQDLQYQETGKSLSMNLSGDVLFDYDKA